MAKNSIQETELVFSCQNLAVWRKIDYPWGSLRDSMVVWIYHEILADFYHQVVFDQLEVILYFFEQVF